MAATVIKNFIAKALFKQKGAIANNKSVEFSANALENRLKNLGINPDAITSEKELNQILSFVKQAEDQAFNQKFGNVLSRSNLERKGEVFDMTGKKINTSKGIMGGKEINEQTLKEGLMKTDNPFSDLVNTPRPKTLAEREAEVLARLEKENKAAAQRIRDRKADEKQFNKDVEEAGDMEEFLKKNPIDDDTGDFAQGGRAGFKAGLSKAFLEFMKKFKVKQSGDDVKDFLSKRQFMKDMVGNTKANERARELTMLKENLDNYRKRYKGYQFPSDEQIRIDLEKKIQPILNKGRKLNSDGGRAGFKSGLGIKFLKFLNENNPVQAYTKYLKSVKDRVKAGKEAEVAGEVIPIAAGGALITNQVKKKLKAMNEEQKKEFKKEMEKKADGGRIGLKDGMDRRTFLKIAGGLAALPFVGKFFRGAKVASKSTPVAKEIIKQSSTPPPYFFELANKIKTLGKPDKVTYADRVEIHRYRGKNGDEYELIEDLNTGDVRITKDKTGIGSSGDKTFDTIEDRSILEYKKGDADIDPETGTAFKSADEYEEYKVEFDADGTAADATELDAVVQKEIIEEAGGEAPSIKKAGGGIARMLGE